MCNLICCKWHSKFQQQSLWIDDKEKLVERRHSCLVLLVVSDVSWPRLLNWIIIIIIIIKDNVYGAVIVTYSHCESSFVILTNVGQRAGWPPTLRPSHLTWALSPPVYGCDMTYIHHRHLIITQLESWYSFYRPTEGGRLSQPTHTACSPI